MKIEKQTSLIINYIGFTAVSLFGSVFYKWVFGLAGDYFQLDPGGFFLGKLGYYIIAIYVAIVYALAWIGQILYILPIILLPQLVEVAKKQREITINAAKAPIVFQSNKLLKTLRGEGVWGSLGFGAVETTAFLGAVHTALRNNSEKKVLSWLLEAWKSSRTGVKYLNLHKVSIKYPDHWGATLPVLLVDGFPCLTH